MSDAAIRLEGVTKSFGEKVAVDHLDLVVPTGSVCGFLGPNGAGKTTTIRMIMGIFHPDSGEVHVLGKRDASQSRHRVGYLPEERGVYRTMRVGEFLAYMAKLRGVDGADLSKSIDNWLERVDLPGVRKKRCEELSKGMQQKVQFLASIIHDPELVILDEPFSGLDPVNARLLRSLIDELHASGKTIIFSTHVLASAEQVCDRVFMINRGKKVLDGPLSGVRSEFDPRTVVVEPEGEVEVSRLESLPGVQSVSRLAGGLGGRIGGSMELHLSDGADPRQTMRAAMDSIPIRRIELRQATLEDIFVSLVDPGDSEDTVRAALSSEGAALEVGANA